MVRMDLVMYDWHAGGWGPGAWVAMGLMMLVFWGSIAALVVYMVRSGGHRHDSHHVDSPRQDQAIRILDERFARGEIDAEDYSARRDLLRSS